VSAILVASEAIAAMALGRLPGGGSASIAAVVGGAIVGRLGGIAGADAVFAALEATPTNSVPDLCMLRGEVRGYSEEELRASRQAMEDALAAACDLHGATYEWHDRERAVPPFPGAAESRALQIAQAACARVPGAEFRVDQAHATLEANYLAASTDVVALASGGRHAHQFSESIAVTELQALEALLCAIVTEATPG
jgi:tripeptide aminopeptidase